jgi:hypothetical protein
VQGQVARPGPRLGGDLARPVWRYRAGARIELQLHYDVTAEHWNVHVFVAGIDDHAMRLGLGVEDLGLPGLSCHPLKGDRQGTWAVSVSGNWRVTFRFVGKDADAVDYEDYH